MEDYDYYDFEPRYMNMSHLGYRGNWFSEAEVENMTSPVQCAFCSHIYDLGTVTITASHADCTMWRTPCCNNVADDRGESGWKSRKDYYTLKRINGVWSLDHQQ